MKVPFSKYSGCGNDFIVFDNRIPFFPHEERSTIQWLCHRQQGIGADGVILLEHSTRADYRMRIFNADGSEAEMCGNGLRCLLKFMRQKGLKKKQYAIETMCHIHQAVWEEENIIISLPPPSDIRWDIHLAIDEIKINVHHLDTSVPHVVHFIKNEETLSEIPIKSIAPSIRFHPFFAPKGANVNFVKVIGPQRLAIRTYERGVENETLACGTGAVASALAAAQKEKISSPVTLCTASQEELTVFFSKKSDSLFDNVKLKGPANFIYEGSIQIIPK